ncbi:MAG: TGS domain-containing protein, partial [Oscillospiraceae bacterium]
GRKAKVDVQEISETLNWIHELVELREEAGDSAEDFVKAVQEDILSDKIYVFTPNGEVQELPRGSGPIDFAYAIHSAIGNKMTGAKINGKIAPLDTVLQNGDILDIITTNSHGPNLDWLKICKTSQARNKINQWFKNENREENIIHGREIIDKELKKQSIPLSLLEDKKFIEPMLKKYGFNAVDELYAGAGFGSTNANRFITRFKTECKKKLIEDDVIKPSEVMPQLVRTTGKPNQSGVTVSGVDNCLIRFSHCCNPVPGDKIVGYVTRGRGVAIHRTDCINIIHARSNEVETERIIPVHWSDEPETRFQAILYITATDRSLLLYDTMATIGDMKISILNMNARQGKNDLAIIELTLEINDKDELNNVITRLKQVEGILSVVRRRQ